MSYRVILIDDEPWTLVYMKKTFKWEQMGFAVIAEIRNSEEALDVTLRMRPDVVFTDIRMPKMSGIQLMQKARENGVNCEFVIVSGFADFGYAQEAIKYGAFEYCLKPVSFEKADEILRRLILRLEAKRGLPDPPDAFRDGKEPLPDSLSEIEANANFKKMLEYIRTNLHKKLQLKEVAREFYLNANYCCYLFNKILGMTFSEYLTSLRMKEAEKLIARKELTIEEVAKKIGYDDYFYFHKVFKKVHDITPSEYRKRCDQM